MNEQLKTIDVKKKKKKRKGSIFREYFELFTEVLIFVFFINAFLLQTYVIPSSSMEKTMLIGDHLLVDKVSYSSSLGKFDRLFLPQVKIERGMIVTFSGPSDIYKNREPKNVVKRVIALPGDTIRVTIDEVYVNGKKVEEPYVLYKGLPVLKNFPPDNPSRWHYEFPRKFQDLIVETPQGTAFKVPEAHYFCMGDNRYNSKDSRVWGPLPARYIIGRPWRIYWSYDGDYNNQGISDRTRDIFHTFIHFFSKTRWERTFKKY
jgi:signal peptidase I